MNGDEWGKWVRDNSDKFLLAFIFAGAVTLVVHMSHDMQRDSEAIMWARETAGTVLGALLGLITGHALASKATTTSQGGKTEVEVK